MQGGLTNVVLGVDSLGDGGDIAPEKRRNEVDVAAMGNVMEGSVPEGVGNPELRHGGGRGDGLDGVKSARLSAEIERCSFKIVSGHPEPVQEGDHRRDVGL